MSRNFTSQFGQDKFIYQNFFKNKKEPGFFLEIGADDGIRFSNCYFFENELNWKGLAIEARKSAYEKLIKNRACICENCALSDIEEETEFLDIKGYGLGLSGLINKYDKRHLTRINQEIKNRENKGKETYKVKTTTLNSLLDKHNIKNIDFLSIDTEGSELSILSTLNFDNYNINLITIEDNYNDPKIVNFFKERGYELIKQIRCDKIFKKQDELITLYRVVHRNINLNNFPDNYKNIINFYLVKGYNITENGYDNFLQSILDKKINFIEERKLENYNDNLQKNKYHATTLLYHAYINKDISKNKWVGMTEYDINFELKINDSINYNKNQTIDCKNFDFKNEIQKIINFKKDQDFVICLSIRHKLKDLYKQKGISINNMNWLDYFIEDYNKRYKKQFTVSNILKLYEHKMLPTQQSFLCNKNMFNKISEYVYEFINSHVNAKYYPRPATILERYIGMFIILSEAEKFYIPLKHLAIGHDSQYKK